jgi:hypothetical protein
MRRFISITALMALGLAASAAHALAIDAKALARYDISYVKCEAKYPDMRGQRDQAYLSLWRVKPDDKALAELAAVRKGAVYEAERKRVVQASAKGTAPAASSPLEQQCQALWSERQRMAKPAK